MAEERKPMNDSKATINLVEDRLFEVECLIKSTGIYQNARCEVGRRQLLAFTTKHTDIGLFYQSDVDKSPIIKSIPWFHASYRTITALCFDPTGSWLLAATVDGSLYIVPVLALIDDCQPKDNKWSTSDVTQISLVDRDSFYSRPSALTWWQGVTQYSYIGIVGTEDGDVILINLENGQWIGSTSICGSVARLEICQDNSLEIVSLLVTNKCQQQWRLILEQRTNNSHFALKATNSDFFHLRRHTISTDEGKTLYPPVRSRLQGLKQLSVEKLAILRQKLAETRNRSSAQADGHSKGILDESAAETPTRATPRAGGDSSLLPLEPLSENVFLLPQYTKQGQHFYTAYCKTSNRVTIHGTDVSVIPLHMYKLPDNCDIVLSQRMFFVTGPHRRSLFIISCPLSEVKIDDTSHFNPESIIGEFQFADSSEIIKNIYRVTDFKGETPEKNSTQFSLTKTNHNIHLGPVDGCLVVTNYGVYRVFLQSSVVNNFIELALKGKREIDKAIRLGTVFGLDMLQLLECAGDIHLINSRFSEAAILYKLSRCRLLKSVLKTAATGHTVKLLECLNHCLTPPAVSELATTMRIHLSNLTVFAYSELILRSSPQESNKLFKKFLIFLSRNTFYDERWVVDIVGQTCLWKVLHHLTTHRGLTVQVLDVLIKIIDNFDALDSLQTNYGLLICASDPCLLQAMLTTPHLARSHMKFVTSNLSIFQVFILDRLVTLYDPTNPALRQHLVRYWSRRRTTSHSSQSSQCDSLDAADLLEENGWRLVEEFIDTFLLILLTLISKKTPALRHNAEMICRTELPSIETRFTAATGSVDFKRRLLATGYGHVALIRNGNIYTWGNSSYGCLGTGPSISRYGTPQAITVFRNMAIQVLSVSCGRCHTLAVTSNGVYAWGASQYGQLGLGKVLQTPNPELIVSLAQEVVVDAVAGQYHSVALTMDGRVFTWGWGVHGQLGHADTYHKSQPTLVTDLSKRVVRAIAAGHAHSLALTADGEVYAFGSNIFGQLGSGDNVKSCSPMKITLLSEPICDIATGYFHNLAVSWTNKLYTWGSSPQVLRLQTQAQKRSKLLEFQAADAKYSESLSDYDPENLSANSQGEDSENLSDMEKLAIRTINERNANSYCNGSKNINMKEINLGILEEAQTHLKPVLVDTSLVNGRIVQISTGCHHSALVTKDGTVYCWGRNLDGQIGNGTRRDVSIPTSLTYNPVSVLGQVAPRNSNRASTDANSRLHAENAQEPRISRVIKAVRVSCGCEFTVAIQPGGTVLAWGSNSVAQLGRVPTKEAGATAEKLVLIKSSKRMVRLPHGAHVAVDTPNQVPNIPTPIITYQSYDVTPLAGRIRPLSAVHPFYDELTLHFTLEQFHGFYEAARIMELCEELQNYQALAKVALLERKVAVALNYQLKSVDVENRRKLLHDSSKCTEKIRHNTELFVEQVAKNFVDEVDECETRKKMTMSSSKSLDSISVPQEQGLFTFDCQGGSEQLCDDAKSEDISLDLTEDTLDIDKGVIEDGLDVIIADVARVINFYINEIEENSHEALREILQTIFDFWLENELPIEILEGILIKHINKLFYAIGLFIFCQNELNGDGKKLENDLSNRRMAVNGCLTTKFCLQVCSSILGYIEESKTAVNFVELFSILTDIHFGPSSNDCLTFAKSETQPQTIIKGIITMIAIKSVDNQPFIHVKDPEKVMQMLEYDEDMVVFTCGHYFPVSLYQTEAIPKMEAELLMAQPMLLPSTAQMLENVLLTQIFKIETVCPQCIPRAIQMAVINLTEK